MGETVSGQIAYGVLFEEGYEFPWEGEENDGLENWWVRENGFKPSKELYDDQGEWLDGVEASDEDVDAYHEEKSLFLAAHLLPVEFLNTCDSNNPIYMLAVPSTTMEASRGNPKEFRPEELVFTKPEGEALLDFCSKYGLTFESGPGWFLTSCREG
jgi:hypothetical protein